MEGKLLVLNFTTSVSLNFSCQQDLVILTSGNSVSVEIMFSASFEFLLAVYQNSLSIAS